MRSTVVDQWHTEMALLWLETVGLRSATAERVACLVDVGGEAESATGVTFSYSVGTTMTAESFGVIPVKLGRKKDAVVVVSMNTMNLTINCLPSYY